MRNIKLVTGVDDIAVKITWRYRNGQSCGKASLYIVKLTEEEAKVMHHALLSGDMSHKVWLRHRDNIFCSKAKKYFKRNSHEIFVTAEVIDF